MVDISSINLDFLPEGLQGVHLVGGTVRDLLMGAQPEDIDLVIGGDIDRAAAAIAAKTGGRVVDLGKKRFAVLRVAAPGMTIDITPLEASSIEADLRQRDFTINAMAYDLGTRRLVDCTGGLEDLREKTIRMVSASTFESDPARLVRAYRMAASFQFHLARKTREAVDRSAHLIGGVSGERIWAELLKLFGVPVCSPTIRDMAGANLLTAIFPELDPAIGCTQNGYHEFDVFEHSLRVVENVEMLLAGAEQRFRDRVSAADLADLSSQAAILKFAALLHDVGKPSTRRVDDNDRIRFPGHAGRSADITATISRRLRLSRQQRETAVAIIRHHIRPLFLSLSMQKGTLGRRGGIRFFNHCGELTLPIIVHAMADIMAKGRKPHTRDTDFLAFCERLLAAFGDYQDQRVARPPLINGHDLIKIFGLFPAPRFKTILCQVDERRLSGELTTRDQALQWVRAHLKSYGRP